jgi:hypothetical protein
MTAQGSKVRAVFLLILTLILTAPESEAAVSAARQSCIRNAMAAGSAAIGNPARLNRLYESYFAGDKIAQLAAGKDWKRYNSAQKQAQRDRVKRFVVQVLAPNFSYYKGSRISFVSESGSKVKGVLTGPQGERRTITWHFSGPCKFVNVGIAGYGSLIGFVGKEAARK